MKMEQSIPKRRHIQFRRRWITQKKAYNIQNTAKVWNQEKLAEIRPDNVAGMQIFMKIVLGKF